MLRARVVHRGVLGLEQEVLRLQVPVHHAPAPAQDSLSAACTGGGIQARTTPLSLYEQRMVAENDLHREEESSFARRYKDKAAESEACLK